MGIVAHLRSRWILEFWNNFLIFELVEDKSEKVVGVGHGGWFRFGHTVKGQIV